MKLKDFSALSYSWHT